MDEAVAALRDAVAKTDGLLKVGVINSLGVRRDTESTEALTELANSPDQQIAAAAVAALAAMCGGMLSGGISTTACAADPAESVSNVKTTATLGG